MAAYLPLPNSLATFRSLARDLRPDWSGSVAAGRGESVPRAGLSFTGKRIAALARRTTQFIVGEAMSILDIAEAAGADEADEGVVPAAKVG